MKVRHLVAFACALLASISAEAQTRQTEELKFRVFLGDKPIGQHAVTLKRDGYMEEAKTTVDMKVKILFVNVFNYQHSAEETWVDGCLVTLQSETHSNGKTQQLVGERASADQVLATGEATRLGNCEGTFAYWDLAKLKRPELINAQTGQRIPVELVTAGREAIPLLDRVTEGTDAAIKAEEADKYRLISELGEIQLWYSQDAQWLALQTNMDGRTVTYLNELLM